MGRTLARGFIHDGLVAVAVTSAADAIAILDQGWNVALSDFRMPGMDGVDLLEEVARLSPTTRRIMLTGTADDPKVKEAVERGVVQEVLRKPATREELRAALGLPGSRR